jgi:hypothetical protein
MRVKDLEAFFGKLKNQYRLMLETFATNQVNLDQMLVEQFVRAYWGDYQLGGGIDFLYNLHTKTPDAPFTKIEELREGFLILDGKAQIGPTVKPGQLYFYALMLYLVYRILPKNVGFIDWSQSRFVWYPLEMGHLELIKRDIRTVQLHAFRINEALQKIARETPPNQSAISLKSIPFLEWTPTQTGCRFCKIRDNCQAAADAGYRSTDYIKRVKGKGPDTNGIVGGITEVEM